MQVTMTVNGKQVSEDVEPRLLLVHFLRDTLGLTGTHWGCDTSNCGACCVLLDGEPVKSCTVLAAMADGHDVTTIEGLEKDGVLDPVQEGFIAEHGLQCGFCTAPCFAARTRTPASSRSTPPPPSSTPRCTRSSQGRTWPA